MLIKECEFVLFQTKRNERIRIKTVCLSVQMFVYVSAYVLFKIILRKRREVHKLKTEDNIKIKENKTEGNERKLKNKEKKAPSMKILIICILRSNHINFLSR